MANTLLFEACQSGNLDRVIQLVRAHDYHRTDLIQGMFISRYHGWMKIHDLLDCHVFHQLHKNTIYRVEGYQFCIADQPICRYNLLIKGMESLYPPTDLILLHTSGWGLSQCTVSYSPNPFCYTTGYDQLKKLLNIRVPVIEVMKEDLPQMVLELHVREKNPELRPIDRKLIPAYVHICFDDKYVNIWHQITYKTVLRFYLSPSPQEKGFNFSTNYC